MSSKIFHCVYFCTLQCLQFGPFDKHGQQLTDDDKTPMKTETETTVAGNPTTKTETETTVAGNPITKRELTMDDFWAMIFP